MWVIAVLVHLGMRRIMKRRQGVLFDDSVIRKHELSLFARFERRGAQTNFAET